MLTHTQTSGVVSGTPYQFRYRAANKLGWGEFSDTVTVYAAEVPAKPTEISTSI